jgi:hypothetical protein
MKTIIKASEAPLAPYYAICVEEQYVEKNDYYYDNSINHKIKFNYQAYFDKKEWEHDIEIYTIKNMKFFAFQANPAKVTTTVNVEITL